MGTPATTATNGGAPPANGAGDALTTDGGHPRTGRCRHRTLAPGESRPSDLLVAFFRAGLAMLALAAGALIASAAGGGWWWHWLALHLALLGGVSQLVLGAGQFFSCAFLATMPPPRRLVAAQLSAWNAGTAAVAVGVVAGVQPLVDLGGGLILAGLVLFALGLRGMERRSLQRARWAVRWYQASASCLALGALVGVLLAGGVVWRDGSLLGVHLTLNLTGWLGTAIVGTLHTFFPSLTGTRLRFERLQGPTFGLWLLGVLAAAGAAAFDADALAVIGWLALLAAAGLLAANLVASMQTRPGPLSLPARLVAVAQAFLVAGLGVGFVATVLDGAGGPFGPSLRPVVAALLVAGWIGLTVAGSLLHLLAVLARVRHLMTALPAPRPALDRATTAVCGLAVIVWTLSEIHGLDSLGPAALAVRLLAMVVVAAQILAVASRAADIFLR
jgi:hypothetical protein